MFKTTVPDAGITSPRRRQVLVYMRGLYEAFSIERMKVQNHQLLEATQKTVLDLGNECPVKTLNKIERTHGQ
jgi:hypothetical protein